jgi:hypothetical protein
LVCATRGPARTPGGRAPEDRPGAVGHSTIAIMLDIYSQVNAAMDADATNTVAALIEGS